MFDISTLIDHAKEFFSGEVTEQLGSMSEPSERFGDMGRDVQSLTEGGLGNLAESFVGGIDGPLT